MFFGVRRVIRLAAFCFLRRAPSAAFIVVLVERCVE